MATDKSEPRVGVILKVAAVSIATLIAVHAVLVAYFDDIARAEERRKFGDVKPEALTSVRADEKARLTSGPMPIDKAMQQLATRRRTAIPEIMPTVSRDLAPLQGWTKMPVEVPRAMMVAQSGSISDAQAPVSVGVDAGMVGDGATPKATRPERAHPESGASSKPPAKNP
jgi:hypothetical protein